MDKERPNILIVMTEHQQGTTVDPECLCRMPNVKERLAGEGMRFKLAHTPTALCAPARASFFSGLYPTRHGMYNNFHNAPVMHAGLFPNVKLFSQPLRKAGYNLSFIGKWHVSGTKSPYDYGWEVPVGQIPGPDKSPMPGERKKQFIPYRQPSKDITNGGLIKRRGWPDFWLYGRRPGKPEDMLDFKFGRIAQEEIRRLSKLSKPWVIYVGLVDIHDPYLAPEPYASMYKPEDVPLPKNYFDSLQDKPAIYRRMRQQLWSQLNEEQVRQAIAYYWGLCSMDDDVVGMLLDTLEEMKVEDRTIVVYTADHGDQVGGHGLFLKGVLPFEESYRIPMIVRWPGVTRKNSVCSEFVTHCDFAPTLCEIAGIDPINNPDGRSLLSLLKGSVPSDWPQTSFGQFCGTEYYYTQRIVWNKRYKYVFNTFDFDELYDLKEDPYELKNLSNDPKYQEVKKELIGEMWKWVDKTDDVIISPYPTTALVPYGPML